MINTDKVLIGLGQHISGRTPERCGCCPYFNGDAGYGVSCRDELLDDLYEMLEAQEPRVMTLEEACNADCVWYDWRTEEIRPANVHHIPYKTGVYRVQFFGSQDRFESADEYGEYWRCWTSKPSEEQRKAVGWK